MSSQLKLDFPFSCGVLSLQLAQLDKRSITERQPQTLDLLRMLKPAKK